MNTAPVATAMGTSLVIRPVPEPQLPGEQGAPVIVARLPVFLC